ncbi:MAG: hypothetical protein E6902_09455 [Paeniclostridium sordellii]|nr:hypothetical protein [Paeniclostridium sordellii]
MNIDNRILDRLEFIEFKQQVLLLKQPNHKISVFANLSLAQFIDIKNYVKNFEKFIDQESSYTFKNFEIGLYDICPLIKTYPGSSVLIARILMDIKNYDILFSHNN